MAALLLACCCCVAAPGGGADRLAREFQDPPDAAKPWAYWWWLNGYVSRDGLTRDLEEMKRQGINGVLLFNAGGGDTPPGLKFLSPEWRQMYRHALQEATRLGMEVSVNLCDGWDAGGPWITPECANKQLVYSETQVDGPAQAALALPQPPTRDDFYREVAVVAFREPAHTPVMPARVSASSEVGGYCDEKNWPCAEVVDRDPETVWKAGLAGGDPWLQFEYAEPLQAGALLVAGPPAESALECRLAASADGREFKTIAEFPRTQDTFQRVEFPETTARFFRLTLGAGEPTRPWDRSSWIWFPEGNPAASAAPGAVRFRKRFALPAAGSVQRAVFTATADNSMAVYVNGQLASEGVSGLEDFRVLKAVDVAKFLVPGENVVAVAAVNAGDQPNPAGLVGVLEVQFAAGEPMTVPTDESWLTSPTDGLADWQKIAFDDRGWRAAKPVAPFGGGPWGRPASAVADVQVAEVWWLRAGDAPSLRPGIKWWPFKSGNRSFWDWPKAGPAVLQDEYAGPDVRDVPSQEVLDLTGRMSADGQLRWEAPPGRWTVLRFGYTLQGQRTRSGSTVGGYEADMLSAAGIECHFRNLAEPLLAEAGPAVGRTLKYLHVDSYELGADVQGQQPTWSAEFRAEFQARRGYDLLPFLPALARRVVDGRTQTGRFFHDFRHTIGDLMAEKFFGRFAELSHARGVEMHAETGYGTYPHPHFDGLRCAGACDVTMGEFWHGTDIMSQFDPFCNVIRSVASAAHVYGRRLVQAEAFTSWNHFVEYPFALKAVGDQAFCDGLNRMVFHQYTHQPQSDFKPGRQYGAGTHLDRHLTWWEMSRAWFQYLARCQSLLQAGRFHADVCYFYGEGATRYVPGRSQVKPALPFGYDFDCVNADVLLNRLAVKEGRLALPGGLSYRLLVLPEERVMSPRVLQRLRQLVEAGATVVGARPLHAPGLSDYPRCDQQVREEADALWGVAPATVGHRRLGKGTLVWGKELAEVLSDLGLAPDLEAKGGPPDAKVGFIHRVIDGTEAYFVSNQSDRDLRVDMAFRVRGKRPELWEPVSGGIRPLPEHRAEGTRTLVPVQLAPFQSFFVLFRDKPARGKPSATGSFPTLKQVHTLAGPWEVAFDPKWGGPEKVVFETLDDWSQRPEEGIKYYSGTATYRRLFDLEPAPIRRRASSIYLDLGAVRNLARVRLNGHDLGVVWCAPWRVEITAVVKPSGNQLEVQVVNLWPNRLIGDARSPKAKPFTKTNVTTHNATSSLLPSGLLGPVTLWTTAPER